MKEAEDLPIATETRKGRPTVAKKSTETEPAARVPATSPLSTWDPFDRMAEAFGGFPEWFGARFPERFTGLTSGIKVEEYMDGGDLVIRGEIPGVDPETDIEISVDNGRLSIRATREHKEEHEGEGSYRSEFHYGSYARTMTLPDGANTDKIEASYKDGILDLRVPIEAERQTAKKIAISKA